MSPTEQYIQVLTQLKSGELGLLRSHAGCGLDQSVEGFDLFAGLWWPLRAANQRAPRRAVAWLIAKLYACCPIAPVPSLTLPRQLARRQRENDPARDPVTRRFDQLLALPLDSLEPALEWAIRVIASESPKLDWVALTNDLSIWERATTRLKWAEEFLTSSQ